MLWANKGALFVAERETGSEKELVGLIQYSAHWYHLVGEKKGEKKIGKPFLLFSNLFVRSEHNPVKVSNLLAKDLLVEGKDKYKNFETNFFYAEVRKSHSYLVEVYLMVGMKLVEENDEFFILEGSVIESAQILGVQLQ
eukprot:TRINITY_DN6416_c0_g1_i2.p1 TRINITY_DN6416_c0_g1~~TRINITY_DN6416_c0_g1_i2.p1  ORF type:complete len:139 (-),score=33.43 TRINITY_DN6416_c0_g1_i2:39-455(-)